MSRRRKAIVTGAAGQIGSAVARALAETGVDICLADRGPCGELGEAIRSVGSDVVERELDVRSKTSIQATVDAAIASFGRIDILVNVAGIAPKGSAEHLEESVWDETIAINLKGTFLCCQSVIPHMRKQKYGRIINIGSVLGKNGGNPRPWIDRAEQALGGNIAYGISKAGVHAMTLYLCKELAADGITVNSVAPGPVASPLTTNFPDTLKALIPVGRMGTASDVAAAVTFLASESSGFITGEVLDVNGGMWCD